jgi:hypothetical protein
MERKIILFSLITIFLFISLTSSSSYILQKKEIIDNTGNRDIGELHFMFDLEAQTGDYQIVGCEYDGIYFYITGGNNGIDPNKVYKFDYHGNYVSSFNQAGTTGLGWVDLAWDGQSLYGGRDGGIIDVFTTDGTIIHQIPSPVPWAIGIAYNRFTDHLWVTDRYNDTNFYEIDKNGNIINNLTNTKLVYGLAIDDYSFGETYLWCSVFEEGGSECTFYQYSIVYQAYTGASFPAAHPGNTSSNKACGLGFTRYPQAGICLLFAIQQCDQLPDGPGDKLGCYEIMLLAEPIPHICCSESLSWDNIAPSSIINGDFYVENCGHYSSKLNWEVSEWPEDWGADWTFYPQSGINLTPEMGQITIAVEFVAPDDKEKEFNGTIKMINSYDPSEFCEIDVYLQTPRNKQNINSPLLNILENHPNKIIILQKILQRIRPL